jgi:DNA-binding PadR family transcriptional regulator
MSKAARSVNLEHELCHPRAHLKACILLLVATRAAHGYELRDSVKPFGYELDDPGPVYRALRWLEEAGLLHADWETGDGPARRVFSVTPEGGRLAQTCASSLQAKNEALQGHLSRLLLDSSSQRTDRGFEVLIEAKLSVAANDFESASRTVKCALGDKRRIAAGIWSQGEVWVYAASDVTAG